MMSGLQGEIILTERLSVERERILADIANVENELAELQLELTTGRMSRQRAEFVSAQWIEEHRRLAVRLSDLDASISLARPASRR